MTISHVLPQIICVEHNFQTLSSEVRIRISLFSVEFLVRMRLHVQPVSPFTEMLPYIEMLFPRNNYEQKGNRSPINDLLSERSSRWAVVRLLKVETFLNKSEHPSCSWDVMVKFTSLVVRHSETGFKRIEPWLHILVEQVVFQEGIRQVTGSLEAPLKWN